MSGLAGVSGANLLARTPLAPEQEKTLANTPRPG